MDTTTDMKKTNTSVTDEQAMAHVKGLLEFIGEDVNREGLIKTPHRVINAMRDHFAGYDQDPKEFLKRTFSEVEGYNELVVVSDIELHSHCEHHMVPFVGKAHVAYIPDGRDLGCQRLRESLTHMQNDCKCKKNSLPKLRMQFKRQFSHKV